MIGNELDACPILIYVLKQPIKILLNLPINFFGFETNHMTQQTIYIQKL